MIEYAAAFGLAGGALGAAESLPYLRDTLRRTTVPHRGSWLIWGVLEVVAVEAQRADGARWSLIPLATQALGTCLVFVLSLRLGSGGLSKVDLGLIALAGAGVVGWLAADEPVIATACVIAADFTAALMMLPKAWHDPHSETLSTFAIASLGGAMTVGSVAVLSPALLAYPVYFTLLNAGLAGVIGYRRSRLGRTPPQAETTMLAPMASSISGVTSVTPWSSRACAETSSRTLSRLSSSNRAEHPGTASPQLS
jgi:hypothetical protein